MAKETGLRTELSVQLHAGGVLVAESSDPTLWQHVMTSITTGTATVSRAPENEDEPSPNNQGNLTDPIAGFAKDIGVSRDELVGALDPQDHSPYIHLDVRAWETFRKNFPKRGPNAIPRITMAATALVLWFSHAGLGNPTQAQAQDALRAINERERNPSRAIQNCDWLQSRQDGVILNPAEASKARQLVRAFCKRSGLGKDS